MDTFENKGLQTYKDINGNLYRLFSVIKKKSAWSERSMSIITSLMIIDCATLLPAKYVRSKLIERLMDAH